MTKPFIISYIDDDAYDLPQYVFDHQGTMFKWTYSRYHAKIFTDDDVFIKCLFQYQKQHRTMAKTTITQPDIDALVKI